MRRAGRLAKWWVAFAMATTMAMASAGATTGAHSTRATSGVGVAGRLLTINGVAQPVVGFNAYELASDYGVVHSCGGQLSDAQLDAFFASLPTHTFVRFLAAEENAGINVHTHQVDFTALNRVFSAASRHQILLIPVLASQTADACNSHWADLAWFSGGYRSAQNSPANSDGLGLQPLSYWDWVQAVVHHFASSPALGMWEPIGEPEPTSCPGGSVTVDCWGHELCPSEPAAQTALRHFYDAVGGLLHRLDPKHLVEAGLLSTGQCGSWGQDMSTILASPGIDVASLHDYFGATPIGGTPANGVVEMLRMAALANKPLLVGELGITGGAVAAAGCRNYPDRAALLEGKIAAQLRLGVAGDLIWNFDLDQRGRCSFSTTYGDPLAQMVQVPISSPVPMITRVQAPATGSSVATVVGTGLQGVTAATVDGVHAAVRPLGSHLAALVVPSPSWQRHRLVLASAAGQTSATFLSPPQPPPCPIVVASVQLHGALCTAYVQAGGLAGWPGRPLGAPKSLGDGVVLYCAHADLYGSAATGVHLLREDIRAWYRRLGGPTARVGDSGQLLGFPIADSGPSPNLQGRAGAFQGGWIYSSNTTPPAALAGQILSAYVAAGATGGPLGFPVTSMTPAGTGGRRVLFQHGAIFRTPGIGAEVLTGPIWLTYRDLGGPQSDLGLPTSSVQPVPIGAEVTFQHGILVWDRATGRVTESR